MPRTACLKSAWIVLLSCATTIARGDDVIAAGGLAVESPSFANEVIPLLTRFGCNQGSCHGKLAGQNGFRLSLRGFAPEWDHEWISREANSRRVDIARPEQSLLLRKPTSQVPHGGGRLFDVDSRPYQLLIDWIAAGAAGAQPDDPTCESIAVAAERTIQAVGETVDLSVTAAFSDGTIRDVTWLCQFFSSDDTIASVSSDGSVTTVRPGQANIRVHFLQHVEVVTLAIPYPSETDPGLYAERFNPIDDHVMEQLAALNIPPSPTADDAEFLRRVYLDAIGTLPTPDEARAFLADAAPDKRSRLIDLLLAREEFVDYWTLQLGDLLQNRRERDHDVRGVKGVRGFHAWLREQMAQNRSWDALTRDILLATGDTNTDPQIGYYIVTIGEKRQPEESEVCDSVAQTFLGTRIGCARCHNHPLECYTQDDFYHFAGFFGRVGLRRQDPINGPTELLVATGEELQTMQRMRELQQQIFELESESEPTEDEQSQLAGRRDELAHHEQRLAELRQQEVHVRQPRTGEMLSPQALDGATLDIAADSDPREALVDWMVSPENQAFSGAMVNRLWKHYLGVGLVEPVDDLRASNPPTNQQLWDYLRGEFVTSGYDLKHVMRLILNSRTYQLSSATVPQNADDDRHYSHYYARRLPAEVLLDAVSHCTGIPESFPGYPRGMRAIQIPDSGVHSYFLSLFGRSERITACACERSPDVTLPQLLHLQNGDWIDSKLRAPHGRLPQMLNEHGDTDALIEQMFLMTLSRPPQENEYAAARAAFDGASDRHSAAVDLMWSILNSKEFTFNH